MAFTDSASFWSKINGLEYYEEGHVLSVEKIDDKEYHAKVKGSNDNIYDVVYYPNHPRKCTCNCPRAIGKRVVCKHKVAVFYALNPNDARLEREEQEAGLAYQEKLIEEYELRHIRRTQEAIEYVNSLTVEEMKSILIRHKIIELEEWEEQFYESPDEDYF